MDESKECIICNSKFESISDYDHGNIKIVHCPRCGKFEYPQVFFNERGTITEGNNAAIVSYWLRNHQGKVPIKLSSELLKIILNSTSLPKPKEQADNLIRLIGDQVPSPENDLFLEFNIITSSIGATSKENVVYIALHLQEEGLIKAYLDSGSRFQGHLTFSGWERYDEILHESKDSNKVFLAMKFGKEETDHLYKNVLLNAVKDTGFDLQRLDDSPEAGLIDNRLRVEIRRAKFLISDLTHDNPGAYFEAGFAEGLGKKVIYICEKEKFGIDKTHFDTNHHLTLVWDLSEPEVFAEQLKATIRATFPNEAKMED